MFVQQKNLLLALDNRDKQIIQQNKILTGGQTINLRPRQIIYALGAFMDKEDPTFTYNLMMGKICLTLWQFVDLLNLIGVPKDPQKPLQLNTWCLTDFVQNKVSASSTNLFGFPVLQLRLFILIF